MLKSKKAFFLRTTLREAWNYAKSVAYEWTCIRVYGHPCERLSYPEMFTRKVLGDTCKAVAIDVRGKITIKKRQWRWKGTGVIPGEIASWTFTQDCAKELRYWRNQNRCRGE